MGLPVRQRRVLERIESTLKGSDPKLAALYAIFARLNQDEEMPRIEQLRHGALMAASRLRRAPGALARRLHFRPPFRIGPRPRAALFFPIAVVLAVVAIVFVARATPGSTCPQVRNASAAQNKSRLCRSPYTLTPLYAGK